MPDQVRQGRKGTWAVSAFVGLAVIGMGLAVTPASAQSASGKPVRLYLMDGGTNAKRDPAGYGLPAGPAVDHPSPVILIVHPKGSLLWESGKNDADYNRPGGGVRGDIVTKSVKSQLAEVGYPPAAITYLAVSHNHSDHIGNANDFASSTWLVQRAEYDAMFGNPPLGNQKEYIKLKDAKKVIIENKDYDVFGDGTVMIISTPGHTPGHQSLFVKLAKTGPILITGDVYNDIAARKLHKQLTGMPLDGPPYPQSDLDTFKSRTPQAITDARTKLEDYLKKTGAQLWIQHDLEGYKTRKLSPAYYE